MSNTWYDKTKTAIGKGLLDLSAIPVGNLKMIAIETGLYTFSQTHEFLTDVPVGARLATATLTNTTFGVSAEAYLDADDVTYTTPAVGTVVAFVLYVDSGVEATSRILCFIDSGVTLPITTESGRDLDVAFQVSGIAKL